MAIQQFGQTLIRDIIIIGREGDHIIDIFDRNRRGKRKQFLCIHFHVSLIYLYTQNETENDAHAMTRVDYRILGVHQSNQIHSLRINVV